MLTHSQEVAFKLVKEGKSIFIAGPGGCGKTFLIERIREWGIESGKTIALTALTGRAANLFKGRTIHSWAGIMTGEKSVDELYRLIRCRPKVLRSWLTSDILVVDEISMMSAELFNKLVLLARRIRRKEIGFGGIQILFSGDFCQLPPVKADRFCFESKYFPEVIQETVQMTESIRQTDSIFLNILNEIRFGDLSDRSFEILKTRLITDVDLRRIQSGNKLDIKPTLLYPRKDDVSMENETCLQALNEEILEIECVDKYFLRIDNLVRPINTTDLRRGTQDSVDKMFEGQNFPKVVRLAVGAQVMYTRNMSDTAIVNGSRGVIVRFAEISNFPIVRFDEESGGIDLEIVPIEIEIDLGEYLVKRKQIPLILCWAITCHKSQGSTLTNVVTNLAGAFCAGQVYVTLSRVRSLAGLQILDIDRSKIWCDPKVRSFYLDPPGPRPRPEPEPGAIRRCFIPADL